MVARSASRDETRPILTGILVSAEGAELKMVATDSYRLSVKETTLDPPIEGGFEANVPARALQELERIVRRTAAEERIRIGVRANQVVFEVAGDRAVLAADRGPVPQLPPAAARELRARAADGRRGVRRRRAPDQPDGAEERAAAAELQPRAS